MIERSKMRVHNNQRQVITSHFSKRHRSPPLLEKRGQITLQTRDRSTSSTPKFTQLLNSKYDNYMTASVIGMRAHARGLALLPEPAFPRS